MLERLSIRDFQCHERLSLDFDPGVSVLVGKSDSGKSAVLRAIRWAALNKPAGTEMIRWGQKETKVTLKVDGRKVTRKRNATENLYLLDGKEFAAVRSDVPGEIEQFLALSDLNVQTQIPDGSSPRSDPLFWFAGTAGEVSRDLNAIINLGLIDSTMANLATELKRARAVADVTEQRLGKAEAERDRLDWVKAAEETLTKVIKLGEDSEAKRREAAFLRSSLETARKADLDARTLSRATLDAGNPLQAGKEALDASARAESLRSLLEELREAAEQVNVRIPESDMDAVEGLIADAMMRRTSAEDLKMLLTQLKGAENDVLATARAAKVAKRELMELTKGQDCPVCGEVMGK